ncbi:MAG TPA: hypothetical protein DEQ34_00455, partial [Balneolaceae bacterium]|nr:hypothetical protein [Balneolaceae bacterium]
VWTFLYGIVWAVVKKRRPSLWLVFIFGTFYGLLIEILQLMLPTNRSPELLDFIADALGSGLSILLLIPVFRHLFPKD